MLMCFDACEKVYTAGSSSEPAAEIQPYLRGHQHGHPMNPWTDSQSSPQARIKSSCEQPTLKLSSGWRETSPFRQIQPSRRRRFPAQRCFSCQPHGVPGQHCVHFWGRCSAWSAERWSASSSQVLGAATVNCHQAACCMQTMQSIAKRREFFRRGLQGLCDPSKFPEAMGRPTSPSGRRMAS